jgi:hypothetical protein
MRSAIFASILVLVGCHKSMTGDDTMGPDAAMGGDTAAFTIQSTDTVIMPGQEVTYCYYFHTPNTAALAVNKWVADMTPGSHHMIFFTGGADHPDGIDMTNSCGLGTSVQNVSQWVFASQTPHTEEDLPTDDGAGKPLAQLIQPNTLGSFQMHYLNTTDNPLTVHVKLSAYALPEGMAYTRTDAYITYNQDISIAPGALNFPVSASCNAPPGKFWLASTHAHKQAIHTDIFDGSTNIFHSDDWQHPGAQLWSATPFYTFSSNTVKWTCTYNNTGDNAANTIKAGPSAQTNEMCMATGYFFPSTAPMMCVQYGGQCYCQ